MIVDYNIPCFIILDVFYIVYYNIGDDMKKRFLFVIGGTLYIVLANLFRLTFICTAIYVYGNEAYYLSHTVIGRIVFFMFSIFYNNPICVFKNTLNICIVSSLLFIFTSIKS